MNVFEKFLTVMKSAGEHHRKLAKEFSRADKGVDSLNDTKYHDGMADMASSLRIRFLEIFSKELSPCGLLENIDDPIGEDIDKFTLG